VLSLIDLIPPSLLASIPSPSTGVYEIGPVPLRMYGLSIAFGVIAAVVLASKRWEARGGNPDDISTIALWAVPAGVIGARLYHVATDWNRLYADDPMAALKITDGGLGIPGGVALGVIVGIVVVKVKRLPVAPLLDVVAPAIPLAQAIGRLGNWFNQELFGRPTTLPWGLEIEPQYRPDGYEAFATFHPTFLYEALWNLAVVGLLIWIDRKRKLRDGELFGLYLIGYAIGRFWVESLRIDTATLLWGVRVNTWMSLVVAGTTIAVLVWRRRTRHEPPRAWEAAHAAALAAPAEVAEGASDEIASTEVGGATGAGSAEPASDDEAEPASDDEADGEPSAGEPSAGV
jgi:prolipoprotein diacylglyceryl transferase